MARGGQEVTKSLRGTKAVTSKNKRAMGGCRLSSKSLKEEGGGLGKGCLTVILNSSKSLKGETQRKEFKVGNHS